MDSLMIFNRAQSPLHPDLLRPNYPIPWIVLQAGGHCAHYSSFKIPEGHAGEADTLLNLV